MSANSDRKVKHAQKSKKKKGLLKDPQYEKLQKRWFQELEEEARALERRAEQPVKEQDSSGRE